MHLIWTQCTQLPISLLLSVQAHRAVRHIARRVREGKAQDGGGQCGRGGEAEGHERGGEGQAGGGAAKGLRHSGDPGGVGARVGALVAQPRAQEHHHLGDTHLPHVRALRVSKVMRYMLALFKRRPLFS